MEYIVIAEVLKPRQGLVHEQSMPISTLPDTESNYPCRSYQNLRRKRLAPTVCQTYEPGLPRGPHARVSARV